MGYSISIDWREEYENYENHGRSIIVENCKHKSEDDKEETQARYSGYCEKCDISEDSQEPMMNYGYPLDCTPSEEDILKVCQETNCTVVENNDTGEYFLALCGGGMDLSQDIALAYVILEKWIPEDLITQVCKQKNFSLSKKNFAFLRKAIIEQTKTYEDKFKQLRKDWKDTK